MPGSARGMVFDVTCARCGAVYRSEVAHVGKQIRCKCGLLVKIVPPLDALTSPTEFRVSQPSSTRAPRRKAFPGFTAAAALIVVAVALLFFIVGHRKGRSDLGRSIGQSTNTRDPDIGDEKALTAPEARPVSYHTMPTGARLDRDIGTNGRGRLIVDNGTSEDAVVRLYDSRDEPARSFFVQARSTARVGRIPEGPYELAFTTGLDWVESDDAFRWNPEYFDFDKLIVFTEKSDASGRWSKDVTVTLHPVLDGNIQRRTISREEFLKGHRSRPPSDGKLLPAD
jgi:hypothetical protein